MNKIITYKHESLKDDLDSVRSWLIANKVNLGNSRFEQIYNNFNEIVQYNEQKKLNEYVQKYGFETYLYSSLDAFAFIEIYKVLSKQTALPQKKLRDKLQESIKGPFLQKDENPLISNVNSRNFLFELELAAKISNSGIKLLDLDDIQFEYDSYNFHVECKRLISKNKVEENIEKAYTQLQTKLNNKNDRGIIALSLDKLPKIDDKVFPTHDTEKIYEQLNSIGNIFRNKYQKVWSRFIDIRIISIFLFIKFIAIRQDNDKELPLYAWQIDIIPLCENQLQRSDLYLMGSLANSLSL